MAAEKFSISIHSPWPYFNRKYSSFTIHRRSAQAKTGLYKCYIGFENPLKYARPSAFLCSVVRQNLQRLYLLRGSWLEIQQNIRSSGRWLTSSRHAEILYEKPIHRTFQLYMILSHRPPYMRKAEISCFSNKGGRHLQMYLHFSFRERLQIRRKRWEVLISSPFPALLWHCFR